jgi:hypothetical protein
MARLNTESRQAAWRDSWRSRANEVPKPVLHFFGVWEFGYVWEFFFEFEIR